MTVVKTCEPVELDAVLAAPDVAGLRLVAIVETRGRAANGETWPVLKLVFSRHPADLAALPHVNESMRIAELEEENKNLKQLNALAARWEQNARAEANITSCHMALKVIAENLPEVANLIATNLGVTVGQLRNLSFEGKLTEEFVHNAIAQVHKSDD